MSIFNSLYPLLKYSFAKALIPIIQLVAWLASPKIQEKETKTALIVSSRTNEPSSSFRYLIPELEQRSIHVEYHSINYGKVSLFLKIRHIFVFFCLYKSADFVFLDDTFLPVSFSLKRNFLSRAYVVQLWHSCGVFKRTGMDTCNTKTSLFLSKANYKNYDLVSVSSEECRETIAGFMGIDVEKVKSLGVSRTDIYFDSLELDEANRRFYSDYPAVESRKLIVYAPTYRGQPFNVEPSPIPLISKIFDNLSNDYLPFIVPHPHEFIDNNDYSLNSDLSSILHLVDVLITDYSSLAMEYMIANPSGKLVLFVPDIKKYTADVGFYVNLDAVTDNIAYNKQQLLDVIDSNNTQNSFLEYREKYLNCCNGSSTQQLLQYLDI